MVFPVQGYRESLCETSKTPAKYLEEDPAPVVAVPAPSGGKSKEESAKSKTCAIQWWRLLVSVALQFLLFSDRSRFGLTVIFWGLNFYCSICNLVNFECMIIVIFKGLVWHKSNVLEQSNGLIYFRDYWLLTFLVATFTFRVSWFFYSKYNSTMNNQNLLQIWFMDLFLFA